jgi:hypothetical protein
LFESLAVFPIFWRCNTDGESGRAIGGEAVMGEMGLDLCQWMAGQGEARRATGEGRAGQTAKGGGGEEKGNDGRGGLDGGPPM